MPENKIDTHHPELLVGGATRESIDVIAAFNIAMAQETEALELEPRRVRDGVRAVVENPQLGFYLVAYRSGTPVGCLMVTNEWSDWRNGMFWWIQSVYVTPEQRGLGVYRKLYRDVMRRALDDGQICGIRLYVERDNTLAQEVYQALGMSNSGYLVFETRLPPS